MKALIVILAVLAATAARAQAPRVTVELAEPETVVGQPLDLTVTILVPTWMPKSPVYPSFEVPNLMVRLPGRSTTSISRRIDGETWAGLSRTYRLYPLAAGTFRIPPQSFVLTYSDPETRDVVEVGVPSPELRFRSVVPAAARGIDPLIVAERFVLQQDFEGGPDLEPGDAIVRRVRAEIDGTTAIMIPGLIAETPDGILRAYPAEPVTTETESRDAISGTREERVTYLAQGPGEANLPPIRFDWFNLTTAEVETAELPGLAISVEGEVVVPPDPAARQRRLVAGAAVIAALLLGLLLRRRLRSAAAALWVAVSERWRASEFRAHRAVLWAIGDRDLNAVYVALGDWYRHHPGAAGASGPLTSVLAAIGRSAHGPVARPELRREAWADAGREYRRLRRALRRRERSGRSGELPPLNPF